MDLSRLGTGRKLINSVDSLFVVRVVAEISSIHLAEGVSIIVSLLAMLCLSLLHQLNKDICFFKFQIM
jgi:hypothetical protein